MRVACLVSGGKDSVMAAYTVACWGWDVTSFLTLLPESDAPLLYHRPNAKWVELQAQAANVPWIAEGVEDERDELPALSRLLGRVRADGIVTGALASEFQRTRFERAAREQGLKSFAPLWHHDPAEHVHGLPAAGVEAVIVHAAAEGLDQAWLGRTLDDDAARGLMGLAARTRLNPAGEGGEYETFVVDAPSFSQRIEIQKARREWSRDHGTLVIEAARLAPKRRPPPP